MIIEALLSAATEAIFSRALDAVVAQLKLDERLLGRVKTDPARVAFKAALARAYTAFARQYPDLTPALFTEPFLAGSAAPELAKLTLGQPPNPHTFARLWIGEPRHHVTSPALRAPNGAPTALAVEASANFLRLLEAELRYAPHFRALFDSRALDAIAAGVDALNERLSRLLPVAEAYAALIARAQAQPGAVGGDAGRDRVINDVYLADRYAALRVFYDPPDYVFRQVNVEAFVGRAALKQEIDDFIAARRSGLFLIEGEAGLGKTALLAHLVYTRGYLHVFGGRFEGEINRPNAVTHLAAQVVSRYQIEGYRDGVSLELARSPHFLQRLLEQAAGRLAAGERIVIVYDALDQGGAPNDESNPLGLPRSLPDGVIVLASQRPVQHPPRCDAEARHVHRLVADDPANLADIRAFLARKADDPRIAAQLAGRATRDAFIETLLRRSGGNWMYLYCVLQDIADGRLAPLDLDALPTGLNAYYCQVWRRWRDDPRHGGHERWHARYKPLLCALAAVQAPVGVRQLAAWCGLSGQEDEIEELLARDWRGFVTYQRHRTPEGEEARYHFLHPSLTRFVRGEVDEPDPPAGGLSEQERRFVNELRAGVREAHRRIVAAMQAECAGDWPRLVEDDYARRYLSAHLDAVDPDLLYRIVAMDDRWAKAREAKDEGYTGYLGDLWIVWRRADAAGWAGMARGMRCALIQSSIRTLSGNIVPELLEQLVRAGLWSGVRALETIRQMPDEGQRARALAQVAPSLAADLLGEALSVARAIKSEYGRAKALSALAPRLNESLRGETLSEALAAAQGIKDEHDRADALGTLVPHLSEPLRSEVLADALAAARESGEKSSKARALSALARHLSERLRAEVIVEALAIARAFSDEINNSPSSVTGVPYDELNIAQALVTLAPHLSEPLLAEALAVARAMSIDRAKAPSALAPHLSEPLLVDVPAAVRDIRDEQWWAEALSELASYLDEPSRSEVLAELLATAQEIDDEHYRVKALGALAPYLGELLLAEVLTAVWEIGDDYTKAITLSTLAPCLSEPLRNKVAAEVLALMQVIRSDWKRVTVLDALVLHLSGPLLAEALAATRAIGDGKWRAEALGTLAPHLSAPLLVEAMAVARQIDDEWWRAKALVALAPHLSEPLLAEALAAVREIESEHTRAEALVALAPRLCESLLAEVLTAGKRSRMGMTGQDRLSRLPRT